MLVAVGKDGNHQMYPIAWAVVDQETQHTWGWFIDLLKVDMDLEDGTNFTIVTDMQKGLEIAVKKILPQAEHRMCARHILANWAKKWGGVERRNVFWRCSKATFEAEFADWIKELSTLGRGIPILNMKMWPVSKHPYIAPPEIKTLPGRPKRNRRKPKDELKKFGKMSRNGIEMTCSYCKEVNHNIKGCQKRKEDLRQGKISNVTAPVRARKRKSKTDAHHAESSKTPTEAGIRQQRKKLTVKKPHMAGFGVYVNENTGYSRQQVGKPGGIVISTGAKIIKNSAHVTRDIGFTPTSLKWKGKAAMTPQQLKNQKSNCRHVNVTHQAASTQPSYASSTAASRAGTTSKSQPNVTKWF